jgi:hypothetical protein
MPGEGGPLDGHVALAAQRLVHGLFPPCGNTVGVAGRVIIRGEVQGR